MKRTIAAGILATILASVPGPALALDLGPYQSPGVRAAVARATQEAIWSYVRHQSPGPVAGLPALSAPAGVFVTISHAGVTRGCWGTVEPRQASLSDELATNAVKALSHDYRHRPIRPEELAGLVAHVSVVGELEAVEGPQDLQPRRYGLLVTGGGKGGVLLPGEAATATWQIATCRRKAGLRQRERARLYRFETAVIGPISLAPAPAGTP